MRDWNVDGDDDGCVERDADDDSDAYLVAVHEAAHDSIERERVRAHLCTRVCEELLLRRLVQLHRVVVNDGAKVLHLPEVIDAVEPLDAPNERHLHV
jgi:hypothetical protein